jgi:hypothetical protein
MTAIVSLAAVSAFAQVGRGGASPGAAPLLVPLSGRTAPGGSVVTTETPIPGATASVDTINPVVQVQGAFAGSIRNGMQTGALSLMTVVAETPNPSFLALHPNGKYLYAVNETHDGPEHSGLVTAYGIDAVMLDTAIILGQAQQSNGSQVVVAQFKPSLQDAVGCPSLPLEQLPHLCQDFLKGH